MTDTVFREGSTAVVTGAASGIGLATCTRFASLGMNVCMVDIAQESLEAKAEDVIAAASRGRENVLTAVTDVADVAAMKRLADNVVQRFGPVTFLMNNAVTRVGGGLWGDEKDWRRQFDVNFWGVINGVRAFVPGMIASGEPSIVVNCGSKQGITNPPGNTAYNITKSALKTYTETLQHELRNTDGCKVSAALLVPGWTTTRDHKHQPGAWLPGQVVDYMLEALRRGSFYIICPDDEVTPEMDRDRMLWAIGDITEDRPPLSRWHPDFKEAFEKFKP